MTDFLALPAVPPHSSLPHCSPGSRPSANSLLAVEGVSEPEPSGRVGYRLYLAYFKFFQDQLPCQGRLASPFWLFCSSKGASPPGIQPVASAFPALVGPHTLELIRGPNPHGHLYWDDLIVAVLFRFLVIVVSFHLLLFHKATCHLPSFFLTHFSLLVINMLVPSDTRLQWRMPLLHSFTLKAPTWEYPPCAEWSWNSTIFGLLGLWEWWTLTQTHLFPRCRGKGKIRDQMLPEGGGGSHCASTISTASL